MPRFGEAIVERWAGDRWERLTEEDMHIERSHADEPPLVLLAQLRRFIVAHNFRGGGCDCRARCACGWVLTSWVDPWLEHEPGRWRR
jgi:hypothetical protein